jgi:hypothetical protein
MKPFRRPIKKKEGKYVMVEKAERGKAGVGEGTK